MSAYQFSDHAAARAAATDLIAARAADGTELFEIPEMPRAVGLRFAASAWTWRQPTDQSAAIGAGARIIVLGCPSRPGAFAGELQTCVSRNALNDPALSAESKSNATTM